MADNSLDVEQLRNSGLVAGIEFHSEIASTNDRADILVKSRSLDCPFLICAETQTAGRGRGANRWWTAPGALTFSLVIDAAKLQLAIPRWPQVALAAGLAVSRAIETTIPVAEIRLKWPNDVYLQGKKACGILVEAPAIASGSLIIGIGVNVNNAFSDAPAELVGNATSLADVAGRTFDLTGMLLAVLSQLNAWLPTLSEDPQLVLESWRRYCLLTGKRVRLSAGGRELTGLCRGIDDEGRLLIETQAGLESCASGTVVSFD